MLHERPGPSAGPIYEAPSRHEVSVEYLTSLDVAAQERANVRNARIAVVGLRFAMDALTALSAANALTDYHDLAVADFVEELDALIAQGGDPEAGWNALMQARQRAEDAS